MSNILKEYSPNDVFNAFPCDYVSQNHAWMTGDIFMNWIKQLDFSFKKQNRNILLDNYPAHPISIQFKNIKLVFFTLKCNNQIIASESMNYQDFKTKISKKFGFTILERNKK